MKTKTYLLSAIVSAFLLSTVSVYAEETLAQKDMHSKIEMHEHMSIMHKNAADCLKSGKTEKQCQTAMMAECKESMKGDMDCKMMEKMHKKMNSKMKM
jgi:hypothetical protein